ncbi:MAG: InlB B-repeat-containing protein [Oscillospiraceae bacterium]|nr:InlB B-repeat-containing protein [Oscillospiraceae bacterium]
MKLIRNAIFALLLCLLCMLLLRAAQPLRDPGRVWIGGRELTGGGEAKVGGGSAVYDAAAGTLTLTDAFISGDFRGAAIYAEGDLTILLAGDSRVEGTKSGCTVLGDLTLAGQGTLTLSGARSGAAVHGCITVFDSAQLDLRGQKPLRWGKLHISPLDTVFYYEERMRVCAPNTVYLTDGAADAAGNPLLGEPMFESFALKLGEPVPEPAEPSREGYWFGGWYADPELTEPFDFTLERSVPITIYARWIRIVTLSFDCWGGEELPEELFAWGDVPERQPVPGREGYRFTAWYADDRLRELYDWSQPLVEDRTLYAKWEKNADITLYGIDAARYQGEVDWEAVKAGGVSFVFLRLGFRGYTSGGLNKDDNFEVNYEGASAAGLEVGVYFYSQAVNEAEAVEEARYVLEELQGRNLDLPVVLDYELAADSSGYLGRLYEAGLSGEQYAAVCLAFCREIELNGYTAAVYAGQSMLRSSVGDTLTEAGYPVWLAHWTVQTRYNGAYDYWQYSGSGHVSGIDTDVDLDMRYVTAPPQVSGLTARRDDGRNVLHWDRVPGVQGYVVFRSAPDSGFAEIARLSGAGSVHFTDAGADARCRYMVCAVVRVEGSDLRGVLSDIAEVGD